MDYFLDIGFGAAYLAPVPSVYQESGSVIVLSGLTALGA